MPLSIATPNTAMNPMADGTDRYCPVSQCNQASNGRERHVGENERGVLDRVEGGVEQYEDEEDRDGGHDHRELGERALLVLERAAPFDPVAGGSFTFWAIAALASRTKPSMSRPRTSIWMTA